MILLETFKDGTELNLISATFRLSGHGHYTIEVELEYEGQYKKFKHTTTNVEAIDEAKELGVDSWEDRTKRLYDCIDYAIEDNVQDWLS